MVGVTAPDSGRRVTAGATHTAQNTHLPSPHLFPLPAPPLSLSPTGSDGCEYMFLLKGHEDLRQDERVMQLFELINTLLATNQDTFKRHLQ